MATELPDWLNDGVLGFAVVSAAAGGGMFWHLKRAPLDVRRRLFWRQLVGLVCVDLLQSFCKIYDSVLISMGLNDEGFVRWFGGVLDFSSCSCELCIAAGFVAAAAGWPTATSLLRVQFTLPVCIALNCSLNKLFEGGSAEGEFGWAWTIVSYASLTTIVYLCGLAFTLRGPLALRRRTSVRALSYGCGFLVTFAPYTVCIFVKVPLGIWKGIAIVLLNSNGAVNALTYAFWVKRPRNNIRSTSELEASLINGFFDLDSVHTDEEVFIARRNAAQAVAGMQAHRSSDE